MKNIRINNLEKYIKLKELFIYLNKLTDTNEFTIDNFFDNCSNEKEILKNIEKIDNNDIMDYIDSVIDLEQDYNKDSINKKVQEIDFNENFDY